MIIEIHWVVWEKVVQFMNEIPLKNVENANLLNVKFNFVASCLMFKWWILDFVRFTKEIGPNLAWKKKDVFLRALRLIEKYQWMEYIMGAVLCREVSRKGAFTPHQSMPTCK